jgi:outer membrane protein assembly factor BamA
MKPDPIARVLAGLALLFSGPALGQVEGVASAGDSAKLPDAGAAPGANPEPPATEPKAGKPKAPGDGWPDLSNFLDDKYGFLPIAMPITEPAVGYGAAGGLAFLSKSLGQASQGLGRPNITFVGGMGTANGSWGALAGDSRYWLDDHLQTLAGFVYASINLDFHGIGSDSVLQNHPLRYNLHPIGGAAIAKYRLGDSSFWAGLGYAFASTKVTFDAPASTPRLPDFERVSQVGTLLPQVAYDTRDNIFTPLRGVYLEAATLVAGKWLGGDDNFERVSLTAIQYVKLPHRFFFGLRSELDASFGNTPFYMRPSVSLRGVAVMRYQGDEAAAIEAELRWQFWKRLSILGFVGAGDTWNNFEKLDASEGVLSGGGGFRYELARRYGIHMGVDVAHSRDTTAFYVQVGSAWMRP